MGHAATPRPDNTLGSSIAGQPRATGATSPAGLGETSTERERVYTSPARLGSESLLPLSSSAERPDGRHRNASLFYESEASPVLPGERVRLRPKLAHLDDTSSRVQRGRQSNHSDEENGPVVHVDVAQIVVQTERPIQSFGSSHSQPSYLSLSDFLAKREEALQ
jgi:hypothetical protein